MKQKDGVCLVDYTIQIGHTAILQKSRHSNPLFLRWCGTFYAISTVINFSNMSNCSFKLVLCMQWIFVEQYWPRIEKVHFIWMWPIKRTILKLEQWFQMDCNVIMIGWNAPLQRIKPLDFIIKKIEIDESTCLQGYLTLSTRHISFHRRSMNSAHLVRLT